MTGFRTVILALTLFLLAQNTLVGQLGVRASYQRLQAPVWSEAVASLQGQNQVRPLFEAGMFYEADYWFRLRNARVEFFPALGYGRFTGNADAYLGPAAEVDVVRLAWHTQFYLFDFWGNCDCPTFSKQNTFLKKGFFVSVSPSLSFLSPFSEELPGSAARSEIWTGGVAVGAGLDMGFSDFFTLTPFAQYGLDLNASWEDIPLYIPGENLTPNSEEVGDAHTALLQRWQLGVRLGFRWRR